MKTQPHKIAEPKRRLQRGTLTTGDIARFCRVAPGTVVRWITYGELDAHRIRNHRRVSPSDLDQYMQDQNMPADWRAELAAYVRGERELP